MLKQECVTGTDVQYKLYLPVQVQPDLWMILCDTSTGETMEVDGETIEKSSFSFHCGRRTGQPVVFSRYSDAERLCDVLNGSQE